MDAWWSQMGVGTARTDTVVSTATFMRKVVRLVKTRDLVFVADQVMKTVTSRTYTSKRRGRRASSSKKDRGRELATSTMSSNGS